MHDLEAVVREVRNALQFHRRRARVHLITMLFFSVVVFMSSLAFGGFLIQLLQTTAAAITAVSSAGLQQPSTVDFTKLAAEHNLGYVMLSGFVLMLFFVAGLLRHHVKRATVNEDRLYHVLKVSCLRSPDTGLSASAQKSLLDLRENEQALAADAEAHGGLAVIERSLASLSQSVGEMSKRRGK
ncbi:TPA: hypothetical protein ACOJM5_001521 [Pseudomonas putida]